MNIEDLFKDIPVEPITMTQKEFFEKTKAILTKINYSYSNAWQTRLLLEEEFPEENICDKCTGCGVFLKNGEERDCFQDKEQGDCFHRFCDYEQVGMEMEDHLSDMHDLMVVDEIVSPIEEK
jgi:hypothetical protein